MATIKWTILIDEGLKSLLPHCMVRVWIECPYCKNLLFHYLRLLQLHLLHKMQHPHSFTSNRWCSFVFHPTCKNCKDLIIFLFKFHSRSPCHHGPIWWYCKNLVHCNLSPITLRLVHYMQYPTWMLPCVLS